MSAAAFRYTFFVLQYAADALWPLTLLWMPRFLSLGFQWVASWLDDPEMRASDLNHLHVTVAIPCYNEDPELLDRCIWALVNQSRPPQRIDVVDDGSRIDYTSMRRHWTSLGGPIDIRWHRQRNGGKKHAQARAFTSAPEADIFAIIDSDTALEHYAMEEALKPFRHGGVASVAGIELAMNARKNWLTCTVSFRSRIFQFISCAAQSAIGDVLINRGAFFLIRASVVREALSCYLGETLMGRPVKLGDDAALTLFARARGRTVQQSTAFALTMYPEKLSHHLRQWLRWMRGSTIRNFWRIRYLSPLTFGWWFTFLSFNGLFLAASYPVIIAITWPQSARSLLWLITLMIAWAYIFGLRGFCVRRDDDTWSWLLLSWLAYPTMMIWQLLILRPIQFYGTLTCVKQKWSTRANGAEVSLVESRVRAPAR